MTVARGGTNSSSPVPNSFNDDHAFIAPALIAAKPWSLSCCASCMVLLIAARENPSGSAAAAPMIRPAERAMDTLGGCHSNRSSPTMPPVNPSDFIIRAYTPWRLPTAVYATPIPCCPRSVMRVLKPCAMPRVLPRMFFPMEWNRLDAPVSVKSKWALPSNTWASTLRVLSAIAPMKLPLTKLILNTLAIASRTSFTRNGPAIADAIALRKPPKMPDIRGAAVVRDAISPALSTSRIPWRMSL